MRRITLRARLAAALVLLCVTGCWQVVEAGRSPSRHHLSPAATPTPRPTPTPTPVPTPTSIPPPTPLALGPGVPVLSRLPIAEPAVFITIDDGWVRTPEALSAYEQAHVPATLFLNDGPVGLDAGYFKRWEAAGATIEDHSATHPNFRRLGHGGQQYQICQNATTVGNAFGRRPTLFRPPYGELDGNTPSAAQACGMHAIVLWRESVDAGRITFQEGDRLQPGDIVLMHFRPTLAQDLAAVLARAQAEGLRIGRLEDYL
jgi:peptidoglycan/xylan/chitin deacetylase (PgdA/CDA1 family)